ncbi:hypothetical protein U4E84_16160, partial [Halorubrum sp. AD140]|uniref:hypothetical protein n=1 Tax=Halorubrum sp. AD140 TaxID=3050073 RepID=UPI002ACCFDEA
MGGHDRSGRHKGLIGSGREGTPDRRPAPGGHASGFGGPRTYAIDARISRIRAGSSIPERNT